MDVVLISARAPDGPHWSRPLAADVAARLAARGMRPRWFCPVEDAAAAPASDDAVEVTPIVGPVQPFRRVQRRVAESRTDAELAAFLRPRRAVTVLHLGFGAPGSASALWIAERMGARALALVRAKEVVCHRRDLIHASGEPCGEFTDPVRCAECCRAPMGAGAGREGLTPWQATRAKWLRPLRGLAPFPTPIQFLTRADKLLGSLLASEVLIADEADREPLQRFGVAPRTIRSLGVTGETALAEALSEAVLAGRN